jgi:hypothetical protein
MSWNISNDGRVTALDDGPMWPWFIGPEPEQDSTATCPALPGIPPPGRVERGATHSRTDNLSSPGEKTVGT